MARKNPVSDQDKEIARRLRDVRLSRRLSQVAVSKELGIDSNRLASYEHGRVPIPYEFAARFCEQFDVNQVWLAEGIGRAETCLPLDEEFSKQMPSRARFSAVYSDFLKPRLGVIRSAMAKFGSVVKIHSSPVGMASDNHQGWALIVTIREALKGIPREHKSAFVRSVTDAISEFLKKQGLKIKAHPALTTPIPVPGTPSGLAFDKSSDFRNSPTEMKLTLSALMDKVRKLTKPVGMKARLADAINVPPARVSEWLSGKHDPSGEVTLQLLHWVEQQERKK